MKKIPLPPFNYVIVPVGDFFLRNIAVSKDKVDFPKENYLGISSNINMVKYLLFC